MKEQLEQILPLVQKPARYTGGEVNSVIKDKSDVKTRFAFCFPDTYDIGMSHLGMKILYSVINNRKEYWCERVFAPAVDMEGQMRQHHIPLYALESKDPISAFDIVGFTLQYELSYSNILNMLDLAGIPVLASQRQNLFPLVVAGGPCACNPEPLADFIDLFMPGEGEEVILELCDAYTRAKEEGLSKKQFLEQAAQIEGIYVPSLYTPSYNKDNTIAAITPCPPAPAKVKKRIIEDFNNVFYPESFVVPYTETVHDRAIVEVLRGCIRGCRFCQAGFIYRPFREKNYDTLNKQGKSLCDSTGYEEISLSSLSTSDYSKLDTLLSEMMTWTEKDKVNMSLPSLRIDGFSDELLQKLQKVRKSGLTFAPEAGSQRLRDVINKNITEEEILQTAKIAFAGGHTTVKLYFMIGLPTETMEDIKAIADLGQKIVDLYYSLPSKPKGKPIHVSISVSSFVPKAFTPFEFEAQNTPQQLKEKQEYLLSCIKTRKISVSWHDVKTSFMEGIFARGDRRLGKVLYAAWKRGCKFDSWGDMFRFEKWMEAFQEQGIDPAFYAHRQRDFNEVLPWDHMDYFVSKDFLIRENKKAKESKTTPNCRLQCSGCGANEPLGGSCFD